MILTKDPDQIPQVSKTTRSTSQQYRSFHSKMRQEKPSCCSCLNLASSWHLHLNIEIFSWKNSTTYRLFSTGTQGYPGDPPLLAKHLPERGIQTTVLWQGIIHLRRNPSWVKQWSSEAVRHATRARDTPQCESIFWFLHALFHGDDGFVNSAINSGSKQKPRTCSKATCLDASWGGLVWGHRYLTP